ncbi:TolC family protein [Methylophaga sp.]|jgi:outer membrane protein TolC|uniref:TolC family protein n=1 Tax=Methylophaga sp. TaxID=2024840 RepID=UPI00140109D2|nr:TolC family protein [Methylophaga sp.]MTI63840.1 TolC family protein [Methylophaga sp.]
MSYLKHLVASLLVSNSLVVAAGELPADYADSITLSTVAEQVYQRLPGKEAESKFSQLQQANDVLGNALFAEPATANLDHFNDAIGSGEGMQEWEGSVDMPLWLPGQQQAQQALSSKIMAQLPAYQNRLRLQASGEVRELIWQVKLAEARLEQATQVWETAKKLEQDVASRVKAGDLAANEALLASSNTLEARSQMIAAESELSQQLKTYTLVTGLQSLPAEVTEVLQSQPQVPADHPALLMQDQVIARLQAEMNIARFEGSVNPSVSVGVRRERGDDSESFNNSLGLGFSMPLDNKRYSQLAVAESAAALADAQVARQETERQLNKNLLASQESLSAVNKQLKLAAEQDRTTHQYYQMQKRAFDLGEINLIDLLRSQVLANESRSRKRELEVLVEQKKAAVNQALGVTL